MSSVAAFSTAPWDFPSDSRMTILGTVAFRPPGNPFFRMYLRARPVWVLPPLAGRGGAEKTREGEDSERKVEEVRERRSRRGDGGRGIRG